MVNYIIQLARDIKKGVGVGGDVAKTQRLLPSLVEELNRLDPRDFRPDTRCDFVKLRARLREWIGRTGRSVGLTANHHYPRIEIDMDDVVKLLPCFQGEGSWNTDERDFNFIGSLELKAIIQRDYIELKQKVFPCAAWKSTVILAGSILEAMLFDVLTSSKYIILAEKSSLVPRNSGKKLSIKKGKWNLKNLIEVSADIGVISIARASSIDQVIRDYRNFVHPKKEIRSQHSCTEAEALLAIGALEGLCNHFEKII